MANTIVGLEITEEGVRAAEVTTGRTPTLVAFGSVPLPPEAAKDSEVIDRDAIVLALRQLWSRAGFKSKHVVLGIGSRRILVREYTTASMRPDLLRQALPFQVQDLLPVPADQAVLDFYAVSEEAGRLSGLLVAAVAETVDDLVATVGKAKLTVDTVDLAPFGLARAVARVAAAGETVAALHLGDHTSYVVVIRDGIPQFVRIIPIDIATDAVRTRETVQAAAAAAEGALQEVPVIEELLETVPPTEAPARRLRAAARGTARPTVMSASAIADLVTRLSGTLRFYTDRAGDQPITRVLLSGAGVAVPGVVEALAGGIPIPVDALDVARIVKTKGALDNRDDELNAVTTVGLALGEVR
ncbi:type IV pilus biogenesis protein PilM [Microbacterium sp. bgisy189]|uniref:type IV pilus biogenesis protein PilM n=1 Tax=Microbacterium sp. bgisy189 TaxID=3413798 RepID=UPI003EBB2FEF